ncbi:hypothetical protein AnigIFM59636_009104 [Aspergillus niger]|nr:hypothetical protein AnigIFM59636_009104 [Aspergillus niger]
MGNVSAMLEFHISDFTRRDFGRRLNRALIIPSLRLSLWDVASPLGGLFGAMAAGQLQDRASRYVCLAFAAFLPAAAVAMAYVPNVPDDIDARRAVFLTAKLVQGLAVHMITGTTQTYMFEILPPVLRGPMLAFFPIFILLGQLMGSVVVYKALDIAGSRGYKNCFISQWPFSALPLVVAAVISESPTYLIRKD